MGQNLKTIGFINTCTSWGGGEKWHFDNASFLRQQGYPVVFFCRPRSILERNLKQEGMTTVPLAIDNLSFLNPIKSLYLLHQFKKFKIKTLLLNNPADTKLAAPAAKLVGIPNVIFRRGLPHRIRRNWLNRYLFESCIDTVIANSHAVKATLDKSTDGVVPTSRIAVVENGIEITGDNRVTPLRPKIEGQLVLSTAGRMVKQKNQDALLALAQKLKQQAVNFVLLIAGVGDLEEDLKNAVREKELENYILFTGFIEHMPALFESTDIFVFPSLYEGSPNALIEAAAAAKAIVAFDIPPHRELLPDSGLARLVPLDDIDALCVAVMELNDSAQLREELGQAAKTHIAEHYSLEGARKKLLALI